MKSLAQVLADARQKRGWSQQHLSQETSVPEEFIARIEKQEFTQLPPRSLVKGYIQLLANALHIPEETALALFRRDFPQQPDSAQKSTSWTDWSTKKNSWWKPQLVPLIAVGIVIFLTISILLMQWQHLGQPPQLQVTSLTEHAVVASPISVTGKTDSGATVTINTEIVSLDPQGNFNYQMELPPGERSIVVQARDAQGRLSEKVFFITVE